MIAKENLLYYKKINLVLELQLILPIHPLCSLRQNSSKLKSKHFSCCTANGVQVFDEKK